VEVYQNSFGAGVASARNFGVSKAKHDWLIFMDDDMWVQPDSFFRLLPFCQDATRCLNVNWVYPPFLVQQRDQRPFLRYLHHYGFDSLEGWSSDVQWNDREPFEVKGITSQFLLLHKKAFYQVGQYDVSFPFAGFEDHDLSRRLRQHDIRVFVDPLNMIYHNEADRMDIENWLERKRRGAITRKVGVSVGYKELELHYSILKRLFYTMIYRLRRPFLALLKHWPNLAILDRLYFLLVNVLLGTYSFTGYTSQQAQDFIYTMNHKKSAQQKSHVHHI
jgi:GT2 family glycosyltransferase